MTFLKYLISYCLIGFCYVECIAAATSTSYVQAQAMALHLLQVPSCTVQLPWGRHNICS